MTSHSSMQQPAFTRIGNRFPFQNRLIAWTILSILALPFIIISFFNHPLGDDYWVTSMVRDYGFIKAQTMLYRTVTSRYSLLAIMGVSPVTFGNFWLYKIIPVLFTVAFWYTLAWFFRSIVHKEARWADLYLLSAVITVINVAVMPGLGEGLYWMSSMICYQGGLLFFLWWLALWIRFHRKEGGGRGYALGCCLVLAVAMGFMELLSLLASGLIVLVLIGRSIAKKNVRLEWTMLVIAGVAWYVLLGTRSFEHRYLSVVKKEEVSVFYALGYGIVQVGYHIGKCLLNPVFWIGVLLGAGPALKLAPYLLFDLRKIRQNFLYILVLWLGSMFLISFLTYYFIDIHLVPLRVTNMVVFIFFMGIVLGGMVLYDRLGKSAKNPVLQLIQQYHYLVVSGLFCLALIFKNNYTTSWNELFSGKMSRYDQQMNQRYALLKNCTTDTCRLPYLKDMPAMIRYTTLDTDVHMDEYFHKVIVLY